MNLPCVTQSYEFCVIKRVFSSRNQTFLWRNDITRDFLTCITTKRENNYNAFKAEQSFHLVNDKKHNLYQKILCPCHFMDEIQVWCV